MIVDRQPHFPPEVTLISVRSGQPMGAHIRGQVDEREGKRSNCPGLGTMNLSQWKQNGMSVHLL
jgi:hypothetical protein